MASLLDFCLEQGFKKTYWIAYSGGLDSEVLLHHLVTLRKHYPLKLKAIHVHHGLSENADHWSEHCLKKCEALKVELIIRKITLPEDPGKSREDLARQFRYAVFAELLAENDLLLTGHHQNDQAETVLLQLFRGAGPKGLAAMPRFKRLGAGWHARPLLDYTRDELKEVAKAAQLTWIEDESNTNIDYSRNFLRHQILPLLQTRWPTVTRILARVAENCADAQEVLATIIQEDLDVARGSVKNTLSVEQLKKFQPERQRIIIREWLHQNRLKAPSAKKMQRILIDMLQAREDKSPCVQWGDITLRRYRGNIILIQNPRLPELAVSTILWKGDEPLAIPGLGILQTTLPSKTRQVAVRFRSGGEYCRLPGRSIHHSLKKLFQQWGVPPWQRDQIPLIFVDEELAVVVGYVVCEGYSFKPFIS
jgi:tRNA(Ile)-lysidine synthase